MDYLEKLRFTASEFDSLVTAYKMMVEQGRDLQDVSTQHKREALLEQLLAINHSIIYKSNVYSYSPQIPMVTCRIDIG